MEYQSLYRRYRPQKFGQVKGQRHVIAALQNAVRDGRVGHAYLLSGPRGTGKTTLARILAKILNCEQPTDEGEPCGECASCKSIESGTSFDLHELDAASNNKVDDMRDLLSKVALGTPGRTKVYILDEVHMLSSGAENALLKTLEEPPDHVIFVLATTEPHKVVATIRSRTQHLELTLLGAEEMAEHVRWIAADAGLEVSDEVIDHVVRVGGGSARDTLSALDQVLAAGGVVNDDSTTDRLLDALADRDPGAALTAVAEATRRGRDPRVIGEALIAALRNAFLVKMGVALEQASERERAQAAGLASRVVPAQLTLALETIGVALVDMRQAPDPRIDLEVALVKLTRADSSAGALLARIESLEAALAAGAVASVAPGKPAPPPAASPSAASPSAASPSAASPSAAPPSAPSSSPPVPAPPAMPAPPPRRGPAAAARAQLGQNPRKAPATNAPASSSGPAAPSAPTPPAAPAATAAPEPAAAPPAAPPADEPAPTPTPPAANSAGQPLKTTWENAVLPALVKLTSALFKATRYVGDDDGVVTLAAPNEPHRSRCHDRVAEVEAVYAAHAGRPIKLKLIVDGVDETAAPPSASAPEPDDNIDLNELVDAPAAGTLIEQLQSAFPGSEIIEE